MSKFTEGMRGTSAAELLGGDTFERDNSAATDFIVDDSNGEKQQFNTGAQRDDDSDKPRPDLISPHMMERLGDHMAKGAKKYGDRNWEKGIPSSRAFQSLYRHVLKFQKGDRIEDHLSAMAANIMMIIHNEVVFQDNKEINDME